MARAFVFPGQGSQTVGMGRELADAFPAAREVFEEVDEALKQKLSALIFEGPAQELTLTENAQPALMAASLAVVRALAAEADVDIAAAAESVAGHSLGEYSALCAARALSLPDTARLLRVRGRAMQKAVPVGEGAMAALIGLDYEDAKAVAEDAARGEVCEAANDNAPGQVVVSGHRAAVERAVELGRERGARMARMLDVSAPFHCALMQPAAEAMAEALADTTIMPPAVPVFANVTAEATSDPETIRDLLVRQVTSRVRWRESVLNMKAAGIDTFVELGSGKVLTGLVRRIDRDLAGMSVGTPDDIEEFVKTL